MYNWKGKGSKEKERKFPQVITIFSAPKYTDSYNNKGAIIKFDVGSRLIYVSYSYFGNPNFIILN